MEIPELAVTIRVRRAFFDLGGDNNEYPSRFNNRPTVSADTWRAHQA